MHKNRLLVIGTIAVAIAVIQYPLDPSMHNPSESYLKRIGTFFEMWGMDRWFQFRGPIPAPDDVIVIAIDENSYRELGVSAQKQFPRGAFLSGRLIWHPGQPARLSGRAARVPDPFF